MKRVHRVDPRNRSGIVIRPKKQSAIAQEAAWERARTDPERCELCKHALASMNHTGRCFRHPARGLEVSNGRYM